MSVALVIGHEGQDGRYLSDLLKGAGKEVIGLGKSGAINLLNSDFYAASVTNQEPMERVLKLVKPGEVYYLATFHHSSEEARPKPAELWRKSFEINTQGLINTLEAIYRFSSDCKLFYAASSHIFGLPDNETQNELTPRRPVNIYGISKSAGMSVCQYYRETHGIFATCGILYNHESPLRKQQFLSKKIAKAAFEISIGRQQTLELLNLSAKIDWGFAPDFVLAMSKVLELSQPADFVIATGELHSVLEYVKLCFSKLGLDWQNHVTEKLQSETEYSQKGILCGDSRKLRTATGWQPSINFEQLVAFMIEAERENI